MANTLRQFIADIMGNTKSWEIDDYIPGKFIISKARDITADFLSKSQNSSRLIYKIPEGWTEIEGIPMEEVSPSTCNIPVNLCQKLMKSKYQLPQLYSSKFGPIIKQVMSLNFGTEYYPCFSPKDWKNIANREFQGKRYYFFLNGYLYIPLKNSQVEASPNLIRIEGYFVDKFEVNKFIKDKINSNCSDCTQSIDKCKKYLDYEFVSPYFLKDDIKKELLNQLAQIYLKVQKDEYGNMNQTDKLGQRDKQNEQLN